MSDSTRPLVMAQEPSAASPARPPDPPRGRRRWGRVALVLLVVIGPLLAAEVSLRVMIAGHRLPEAIAHSTQFEVTWANLHRRDQWDVMLLGDSTTQQGINPAVIAGILSDELAWEIAGFNAAVPGSKIKLNTTIARQLDAEGRLPPVVVLGIQPGWLGGNQEFEEFFIKTPMGRIATDCAYETGYAELISCRAEEISVLWRMRGRVRRVIQAIDRPMPITMRGRGGRRASTLGADGYRSSNGTTAEALTAELDRRERKGQLHDFKMREDTVGNFVELVRFLRSRGVAVVAVSIPNIPPLQERLERLYPGWGERYTAGLNELEAAAELEIARPPIDDSWFSPDDAHNVKHLSKVGAETFSRLLMDIEGVRETMLDGLRRASVTAAGVE